MLEQEKDSVEHKYPFNTILFQRFLDKVRTSSKYSWVGVLCIEGYDSAQYNTYLLPVNERQDDGDILDEFREFVREVESTFPDGEYEYHMIKILGKPELYPSTYLSPDVASGYLASLVGDAPEGMMQIMGEINLT